MIAKQFVFFTKNVKYMLNQYITKSQFFLSMDRWAQSFVDFTYGISQWEKPLYCDTLLNQN